jgi:hypothetical protein
MLIVHSTKRKSLVTLTTRTIQIISTQAQIKTMLSVLKASSYTINKDNFKHIRNKA